MYQKLRIAARKVCQVDRGALTLHVHIARQECYEAALADAVRKVDRPTLTALHEAHAGNLG